MICLDMEQGTEAWFQARIGIPTASNFDKIVTVDQDSIAADAKEEFKRIHGIDKLSKKEDKEAFDYFLAEWLKVNKCSKSKQAEKYLWQLAGERITGKPKATYTNGAMQNGQVVEDEARSFYELVTAVEVRRVGICYSDENKKFSCSPDSLVGEEGGLEIKCPEIQTHVGYLLKGNLLADYFQQVQGSLFVTGRKWWDLISYFPGLKPVLIRVQRDEVFIKNLETYLNSFCRELEETVLKLSGE